MSEEVAQEAAPAVTEEAPVVEEATAAEGATAVDPTHEAAPEPAPEAEEQSGRFNKQLEKLMAQARENKQQQDELKGQREAIELAEKIKLAKEAGPDAVLKALGLERQKEPDFDFDKLFGDDEKEEDKSVKELKEKIAGLESVIGELKESAEESKKKKQADAQKKWQEQETKTIESYLDGNKEQFEYLNSMKEMGSVNDVFRFIISMHGQGVQLSHEEASQALEAYADDVLEALSKTEKFKKRFSEQQSQPQSTKTLTNAMAADSPAEVNDDDLSDEENRQLALQMAHSARAAALKKLKEVSKTTT